MHSQHALKLCSAVGPGVGWASAVGSSARLGVPVPAGCLLAEPCVPDGRLRRRGCSGTQVPAGCHGQGTLDLARALRSSSGPFLYAGTCWPCLAGLGVLDWAPGVQAELLAAGACWLPADRTELWVWAWLHQGDSISACFLLNACHSAKYLPASTL